MKKREPNFEDLKKVLAGGIPERPVLFELFMHGAYKNRFAGPYTDDDLHNLKQDIQAYMTAGYDYATTTASRFHFHSKERERKDSLSLNDNPFITDWESFESFHWNDPNAYSCDKLHQIKKDLPDGMRKYIFPWHKRIVELAHRYNRPCVLHSCGYFEDIIDDVIDDMGYDARHSYEDNIMPVEEAYEKYGSRIAILGGMDVDFLCRSTPEEITKRSREMLERAAKRGSYALGTGNSVAYYIPFENYLAMTKAALE